VTSGELPSFDLVVASVDRVDQLGRLFASLETQTHSSFRVLVADQNEDDRLGSVIRAYDKLRIERLRAPRGLSRARNAALQLVEADLVAFPDDDCVYAPNLLESVARRFSVDERLDGVTGRAVDEAGRSSPSWASEPAHLTRENLWNRGISFAIFLRAALVRAVGRFDEQLGLGSGTSLTSGEETEYLVRAVEFGAHIEYDPMLTVTHDEKPTPDSLGSREGASLGYILRKHDYPKRTVTRMLVRPLGGAVVAVARCDHRTARFQLATLRGRLHGYRS
jgi:glycosyltransferase involved in cell wall biosynthesis